MRVHCSLLWEVWASWLVVMKHQGLMLVVVVEGVEGFGVL